MKIKFIEDYKAKRKENLQSRIYELRYYITKFFEDLQVTKGTIELPPWMECKDLMEKLQIDVDHPKIVNFYYKNLQKYKLDNKIL